MTKDTHQPQKRQRAPSQRSLETRTRILDAAERVFAHHGYDGASIREIATEAETQLGLVHHHGGGKEALFQKTVARRAHQLSEARLQALAEARTCGPLTLRTVLKAFFQPYMELSRTGPQWLAYARLVAHVSADPRWRDIAAECFDPTAQIFLDEIAVLLPAKSRAELATGFVFAVSAMLALFTSHWRITALGKEAPDPSEQLDHLVSYCAAGLSSAPGVEKSD